MTDRFYFRPNPPLGALLDRLETPRGAGFVRETLSEFASFVDVLQNTTSYQGSTFVHEPDGRNVQFVNVSEQEFARAANIVNHETGGRLF